MSKYLQNCIELFSHHHVKAIFQVRRHPGASSFVIFKDDIARYSVMGIVKII